MTERNLKLATFCRAISRYCARASVLLGAVVLLGWLLDVVVLTTLLPGLASMKANTALCFLLAGLSLLACHNQPASRRLYLGGAALVTALAVLSLGEYVFALNLGIDQLLFIDSHSSVHPGRMSIATAVAFTLTGVSLLMLDTKKWRAVSQVTALIALAVALLAFIGYIFSISALYGVSAYSSVALHTALGLMVLNVGVLLAKPQHGMMTVLLSDTAGGVMLRELLPVALLSPLLIVWLLVQLEKALGYSPVFTETQVACVFMILFSILLWRTANALMRADLSRLHAEQVLHREHQQLHGIIDSATDAIIVLDDQGRVLSFNPAAELMFRIAAHEMIGATLDRLLPEYLRQMHQNHVRNFTSENVSRRSMTSRNALLALRSDGTEFQIEASISKVKSDGKLILTAILRDVSERIKAFEEINELAFYDTLTRLPNRRLLDDRLEQAIVASKRTGKYGALMFLDLDNFKPVNDRHGHKIGDLLLAEVARRLLACVREVDTVARFGGDEFVVLLSELSGEESVCAEHVRMVEQKIRDALAAPYVLHPIPDAEPDTVINQNIGAIIGVALLSGASKAEDILKFADKEMYLAKKRARVARQG